MELVLLMLLLVFITISPLSLLQYYNLMTSCLSYDIACNTGSGSTTRECSAKREVLVLSRVLVLCLQRMKI